MKSVVTVFILLHVLNTVKEKSSIVRLFFQCLLWGGGLLVNFISPHGSKNNRQSNIHKIKEKNVKTSSDKIRIMQFKHTLVSS